MLISETVKSDQPDKPVPDTLADIRHMVQSCIQCGTCTGSCPNAFAMDYSPRHLWRMVLMGRKEDIFESKTFSMCSSCYNCTLRCPRGLDLTGAMHGLKQLAIREKVPQFRETSDFYKYFVDSILHHGRVHETEVMTRYLISKEPRDPLALFKFAPLGLKLLSRRKVGFPISMDKKLSLSKMFQKVKELEANA